MSDGRLPVAPSISVRLYRHPFARCVLLTFGVGDIRWRLLADCGLAPGVDPKSNEVIAAVRALRADLGEEGADVVVVTNTHRGRVSGFGVEGWDWNGSGRRLSVREVWLPWIESPYDPAAVDARVSLEDSTTNLLATLPSVGAEAAVEIASSCLRDQAAMEPLAQSLPVDRRYLSSEGALAETSSSRVRARGRSGFRVGPQGAIVVRVLAPAITTSFVRARGGSGHAQPKSLRPFDARYEQTQRQFIRMNDRKAEAHRMDLRSMGQVVKATATLPVSRALSLERRLFGMGLVLSFEIGRSTVLLYGDAEWLGISNLVRTLSGRLSAAVGVERIPPEVAAMSTGLRVAVLPDAKAEPSDDAIVLSLHHSARSSDKVEIRDEERWIEATYFLYS